MTDVEARLVALEAHVRELEAALRHAPTSFEWAEYVRLSQLPSILVGPETAQ